MKLRISGLIYLARAFDEQRQIIEYKDNGLDKHAFIKRGPLTRE